MIAEVKQYSGEMGIFPKKSWDVVRTKCLGRFKLFDNGREFTESKGTSGDVKLLRDLDTGKCIIFWQPSFLPK